MATASGGSDFSSEQGLYTDDSQQPLSEFVCSHDLPAGVAVTKGSFVSEDAMIARGDVLLVRGLATEKISLQFSNKTGKRQQFSVCPDIITEKFVVLPPKEPTIPEDQEGVR